MRRIVLLFAAALVTGCATVSSYKPVSSAVAIDFRPVTDDGFLMTPDAYTGPHDPLGMVFITVQAGANLTRQNSYLQWIPTELTVEQALVDAKEYAKKLGGDGIANIEVRYVPRTLPPGTATYSSIEAPGWEIRGLAIKRRAP